MSLAAYAVIVLSASATVKARSTADEFAEALTAFRAGEYDKAAHALPALGEALPRNRDYYLYFLGESQFYTGAYAKARAAFADLSKLHDSRFAATAPARVADCLWMEGKREEAAAAYRKLLGGKPAFDLAVARFRLAEVQAEAVARAKDDKNGKDNGKDNQVAKDAAARTFVQLHVDFPAHPLGALAGKRAALLAPAATNQPAASEPTPSERLQRAATLSKSHHWQEALDELALLPTSLPPELSVQRDLAMGMAKYNARRDYAGAAALLLGVAPKLSGEKAAFAAFHGARALSRIDRDDEAIANYRTVVAKYPGASWAPEAQFRSGWLEINRGHFREALPGLRETLQRYPKSAFADDAAWYLAFAHYLLGDSAEALNAITTYAEVARRGNEEAAMRVRYWRARILAQAGRQDEARALLRECVSHAPYHYYGLLARARLRELGESQPWPQLPGRSAAPAPVHDPAVARALDLDRVGLGTEAGAEIARNESGILKRNGRARALPFLLVTYPRLLAYHRAHKLAEASGEAALGDSRLFWEATYPRAYPDATQSYGKTFGSPELFVYAIMRKESSYFPFALSSSDARGLLQLIPATAEQVAKKLGLASFADELFDPDTNLHLGIAYLGGLLHRFQGQEALAAGAYNAGAHAMMRWCDQWGGRSLDEFVELITYDQAREYIKRVLGIYARYRHLFAQPLELSLAVNTRYAKDGPDF
jgi:soluble lytic murein transglycosylase